MCILALGRGLPFLFSRKCSGLYRYKLENLVGGGNNSALPVPAGKWLHVGFFVSVMVPANEGKYGVNAVIFWGECV